VAGSRNVCRCSGISNGSARWTPANGQLLREHLRENRGRHRIHDDDQPQLTPLGTLQVLARAERAGEHIGAFANAVHREQGKLAVRRIHGMLASAKKYGAARLDQACAMALEMEAYETAFNAKMNRSSSSTLHHATR
jgi:hypothetical protein